MATACVFQINELLEMILINTSAVDCTRFQRVNSTWHTAITNSPPIRRTIFLDPESSFHTHQPVEATEYSDRGCMRPAQAISRIHPALGTIHTRGTVLGAAIIKAEILAWEPGPWQHMSIVQPPRGIVYVDTDDGRWWTEGMQTLGELYAAVEELKDVPGGFVGLLICGYFEEGAEGNDRVDR